MISYIHDGKIEIKPQKGEIVMLLIMCAAFSVISLCAGIFADFSKAAFARLFGATAVNVFMIAAGALFAAAFVLILRHYLKGKPLFTADKNGVADYSTVLSAGVTVPWKSIKNIYIGATGDQKYIELELYDPSGYLKDLPAVKRKNAEANIKLGHQPVCITLIGVGIQPEDVLPDLLRLWQENR